MNIAQFLPEALFPSLPQKTKHSYSNPPSIDHFYVFPRQRVNMFNHSTVFVDNVRVASRWGRDRWGLRRTNSKMVKEQRDGGPCDVGGKGSRGRMTKVDVYLRWLGRALWGRGELSAESWMMRLCNNLGVYSRGVGWGGVGQHIHSSCCGHLPGVSQGGEKGGGNRADGAGPRSRPPHIVWDLL